MLLDSLFALDHCDTFIEIITMSSEDTSVILTQLHLLFGRHILGSSSSEDRTSFYEAPTLKTAFCEANRSFESYVVK